MKRSIRAYLLTSAAILILPLLGGCIRKISGVYKDANNFVTLDFQSDGKVY